MPTAARFAVLAACFLWAVSFIATKIALETTPPLLVVSLRLVISALCFAVWLGLERSPDRPRPDRLILRLFGLSLLGTGLHYGLQTLGLQYTTASNASLYAVTGPITIALFGAAFLGERLGPAKVVGIAVALIGVLVVMGLEDIAAFDWRGHLLGDLLVLISIAMWGLFTVFGKKLTDAVGALRVTALVTVLGAVWMAPVGWVEMRLADFALGGISAPAWLAIAFLGVGCSFGATLLYFIALEKTEAQKVGVYLYTIPPMTAVVAWLTLDERLGAAFVVGSALVFAGVAMTERSR